MRFRSREVIRALFRSAGRDRDFCSYRTSVGFDFSLVDRPIQSLGEEFCVVLVNERQMVACYVMNVHAAQNETLPEPGFAVNPVLGEEHLQITGIFRRAIMSHSRQEIVGGGAYLVLEGRFRLRAVRRPRSPDICQSRANVFPAIREVRKTTRRCDAGRASAMPSDALREIM